jgi:hypothetical protein
MNRNDILYKKVGKKYKPVQIHNAWEYFMNGFYLVHVDDNCRAMYSRVSPAHIEMVAAYKKNASKVVDAIRNGLKMHPANPRLTRKQKLAWEAFEKAMGNDGYNVRFNSIQSIVDDVEKAIIGDQL